jgi:predicted GIY-YIG superfamily endonuclease
VRQYYVHILARHPGGALYVGVTNDLIRGVAEHSQGLLKGHGATALNNWFISSRMQMFEMRSSARRT